MIIFSYLVRTILHASVGLVLADFHVPLLVLDVIVRHIEPNPNSERQSHSIYPKIPPYSIYTVYIFIRGGRSADKFR
jgi:hypothetical protein